MDDVVAPASWFCFWLEVSLFGDEKLLSWQSEFDLLIGVDKSFWKVSGKLLKDMIRSVLRLILSRPLTFILL